MKDIITTPRGRNVRRVVAFFAGSASEAVHLT